MAGIVCCIILSTSADTRHHPILHVLNCYITLKCIDCNKLYLTTELTHSKLKYGWFSRAISFHDRSAQNCQNIHARNVRRVYTHHKRLYSYTTTRLSRLVFRKATVSVSPARCARPPCCWNTKNSSPENLHMSASGDKVEFNTVDFVESVALAPHTLATKSTELATLSTATSCRVSCCRFVANRGVY